MIRHDIAFPFAIDAASGQAAQTAYPDHVAWLLVRLRWPAIGAQLQSSTQMIITQSLQTWLAGQITVKSVVVQTPASTPGVPEGTILITVGYVLIETQTLRQTQVVVS